MPFRIALITSLTIAACMAVPLSVNAVSSPGTEEVVDSDDPDPGSDTVPIAEPTVAEAPRIGPVGEVSHPSIAAAPPHGSSEPSLSGVGLAAAVIAGFVPACWVMARSSRRRRAGPNSDAQRGSDDDDDLFDDDLDAANSGAFGAV
ncbi:hypothetical protein [Haliangium ochraceum]|uniref:Uncharacterized protein n=1 Tax=Haliangium ochraceum (strain DSM 14365 / JCM 11303 / SMP-2) TaxID=502025 RepID=D0LRR9_HALO1|nr:hypothetical protein [Haliangium ochraceum]ACY19061.1 hypothetical protein Hoch_6595 [Haliangium ochraceum DSM 14365]